MTRLLFSAILCLNTLVAAQEPDCESFYPLRVGDTLIYERQSWYYSDIRAGIQTITIDSSFNRSDTTYYLRTLGTLDSLGDIVGYSHDTLFLFEEIVFLKNNGAVPSIVGFSSMEGSQKSIVIDRSCDPFYVGDSLPCQRGEFMSLSWFVLHLTYDKFAFPYWSKVHASPYEFDSCLTLSGTENPSHESYYGCFVRGVGMIHSINASIHLGNSTELIYSNSPCLQNALGAKRKSIKPLRRRSFSNPEMFDLMGRRIKGTSIAAGNGIFIMRSNGVATTQIRMGSDNNRRSVNSRLN